MTLRVLIILSVIIVIILLISKTRQKAVGICSAVMGRDAKKEERKSRILGLLSRENEISNSDVREALRVSDRTAVRYMDELEREGKVEQVGENGHQVTYRLK